MLVEKLEAKRRSSRKGSVNNTLSYTDKSSFPTKAATVPVSTVQQQANLVKNVNGNAVFELSVGDSVEHKNKALGTGKVVEVNTDKNIIKINFNGSVKAYAIDYCIRLNLLTKL